MFMQEFYLIREWDDGNRYRDFRSCQVILFSHKKTAERVMDILLKRRGGCMSVGSVKLPKCAIDEGYLKTYFYVCELQPEEIEGEMIPEPFESGWF
jgi:hypothetical protein